MALAPLDLNQLVQQVVDLTRARWSDIQQQLGIVIELKTELAPICRRSWARKAKSAKR